MKPKHLYRWGLLWRSQNRLDGLREHIVFENCEPVLLHTRREAREFRDARYGYIKHRPDLRAEPHGWTVPKVVRVKVTIEAA